MKALVFEKIGKLMLEERAMPKLMDPKDALVRVTLAAICSSDIHIKHGAVLRAVPGTILGHEFVGVVEAVGDQVVTVKPGDRVAVNVETFCGECYFCKRGYVNNCQDPQGGWSLGCRIDGGQAEYVRIPYADNGLTIIPDGVDDEQALFVGDLLSTGYWGASLAEIRQGDTAAVIGAGPTGLCTMMCARLFSPNKIVAIDTDERRLKLAKEQGLADFVYNPSACSVEEEIRRITDGRGADAVLEAAGGPDTFTMAWKIARANAAVVVAAMYETPQVLPLPDMYGKNLVFKTGGVDACHCDEILKLIADGRLDATCLITHRTTLSHIMEAYDIFENKKDGVIKYAIAMD